MADLLQHGAALLDDLRHRHLTRTVTYQRGEESVDLQATVGRTVFRLEESPSVGGVRQVTRDYLVRAQDLVLPPDLDRTVPKRGDRIVEVIDGEAVTHEVLAPGGASGGGGEPVWRYSDPYRRTLRIHTKQVSA